MRILHHGPEHCFLCHLVRSLYISITGVYSGIQCQHLCKTFRHTPLPFPLTPFPSTGPIWARRDEEKLKAIFLKMTNRPITNISRTISLQGLNRMLSNFNISKGHNYLGGNPPKFAIYEILSLLFS